MSFFLFIKPVVDMLYQYKFLDYFMVGLIIFLFLYPGGKSRGNTAERVQAANN